jgi:hypothetical protein
VPLDPEPGGRICPGETPFFPADLGSASSPFTTDPLFAFFFAGPSSVCSSSDFRFFDAARVVTPFSVAASFFVDFEEVGRSFFVADIAGGFESSSSESDDESEEES